MPKLFGPYGLTEPLLAKFAGGLVGLHGPNFSGALSFLAACKVAGKRVAVSLVGGRENFTNPDGGLNVSLWKSQLAQWVGRGLDEFFAQILFHRLFDEPQDAVGNWGGHPPTAAQLAECADFARLLFPGLKVSLGTNPTYVHGLGLPAHTFDVLHTVYHQSETPAAVLARDLPLCQALGVQYVVGFNVLHGGQLHGTPMSAATLLNAGTAFLQAKAVHGLLLWEYDASYFGQPDVAAALSKLSKLA